ncbi:MAG: hypothetical protein HKM95_04390 [Inquilinus sp.]|nr:hypothetical protein [Inquilinus sp.]
MTVQPCPDREPDTAPGSMPRTLALLVRGKNIHERTLLATDYLNHFNELVMLLDLVPSMPECLEDAKEWRSKSYVEHFQASGFADKALAIFAYENSPDCYRGRLEETIARFDEIVAFGLPEIESAVSGAHDQGLEAVVGRVAAELKALVAIANDTIHGNVATRTETPAAATIDQSTIDEIMDVDQAAADDMLSIDQDEIDRLLEG